MANNKLITLKLSAKEEEVAHQALHLAEGNSAFDQDVVKRLLKMTHRGHQGVAAAAEEDPGPPCSTCRTIGK